MACPYSHPFLTGQPFLTCCMRPGQSGRRCLNPLRIGAVFPTPRHGTSSGGSRDPSLNPLRIGAVFPTLSRLTTSDLPRSVLSQSPSHRGSLSYSRLCISLIAKRLQGLLLASPLSCCQNPEIGPSELPSKSKQLLRRQADNSFSRMSMARSPTDPIPIRSLKIWEIALLSASLVGIGGVGL